MPGLYFDFHFPVELKELLEKIIKRRKTTNEHELVLDNPDRIWYSQPREATDGTVEALTVNLKLPLSVSEVSVTVPRRSCRVEFWYKDRSNNWRQVLDRQRVPVGFTVSTAASDSWYKYKSSVYPIVAKSVQVRFVRVDDGMSAEPYSVGARNLLIKRNIYDRSQGVQPLEEEQDALGNVITKYIKDWDATKAVDDNAGTFWKSAPQPDPSAVVSLYMDVRDNKGNPSLIDKVYIDPVYKGQHLNIYHSSDDKVGERRLSPITVQPLDDVNTEWKQTVGRREISGQETSVYSFSSLWGPLRSSPSWIGIEWTPDFDSNLGPSLDPVLFRVTSTDLPGPSFLYSSGDQGFIFQIRGGGYNFNLPLSLSKGFKSGETLKIAFGWSYSPSKIVRAIVQNAAGEVLADVTVDNEDLPDTLTFDSTVSMEGFHGLLTAMVIKFEEFEGNAQQFLSNPLMYVSPDPVIPDQNGERPSTPLDNAVFAVDWTMQEHGTGGRDESEYSQKVWVPVWRDFTVEKGFHYFPRPVSCKYLKFEMTNLTEEPYPIYEAGIDVQYKVFPIEVEQASHQGPRLNLGKGVGGLFDIANLNGVKGVNWFDINSILDAAKQIFGRQYDPVKITPGQSYVTGTRPHESTSPARESWGVELAANAINRRDEFSGYILAQNDVYTLIKGEGLMKIAPYTNIPWDEILAANPGAIETSPKPGALAVRGTDWWIFPGQTLKIPASVMEALTSTDTTLEIKGSLEHRTRFTTTSVHKYSLRTVRRDAAIAYFAGIREIAPYTASYIGEEDRDKFEFLTYNSPPWQIDNLEMLPSNVMKCSEGTGTAVFSFKSTSTFSKVAFNFRDSGFMKSDAMWEDDESGKLSHNTKVTDFDGAAWLDAFSSWEDAKTAWGSPRGLVSVTLDEDRIYQGKRVLKFNRQPGAGEAGIKVRQTTNYSKNGCLSRLNATLYKPYKSDNEIIVRLVHVPSGDTVFESQIEAPRGAWYEYSSPMFEVPAYEEPLFSLELTLQGDEQDEVYLNDLWSYTSCIRYFIAPGKTEDITDEDLIDVTELKDKPNAAFVAQTPIKEATIVVTLSSDRQFIYGLDLMPQYLL